MGGGVRGDGWSGGMLRREVRGRVGEGGSVEEWGGGLEWGSVEEGGGSVGVCVGGGVLRREGTKGY